MDAFDILIPVIALAAALIVPLVRRLTEKKGGAALIDAIHLGDAEALEKLLSMGVSVDATDDYLGRTPLIVAAMGGHIQIVAILLAKGADVRVRDMEGWTAMRYARGFGRDDIVELLARAGARE
jgi:ankyrin repeat protein